MPISHGISDLSGKKAKVLPEWGHGWQYLSDCKESKGIEPLDQFEIEVVDFLTVNRHRVGLVASTGNDQVLAVVLNCEDVVSLQDQPFVFYIGETIPNIPKMNGLVPDGSDIIITSYPTIIGFGMIVFPGAGNIS